VTTYYLKLCKTDDFEALKAAQAATKALYSHNIQCCYVLKMTD